MKPPVSLWLFLTAVRSQAPAKITDPASLVLPFIGTVNGGHVFPGANVPHGMVKVGMDTDSPNNQAGYDADPNYRVTGFSQLHDTGTGDRPPLSNFKIWPFAECSSFYGCPTSIQTRKILRKVLPDGNPDDIASPGYFSTNLSNGVRVELTSTRRTALHRYTFPDGSRQPRILVDITNDGQRSGLVSALTLNPHKAELQAEALFQGSFGPGMYTAYTCVTFAGQDYSLRESTEFGIYSGATMVQGATNISQVSSDDFRPEVGALFTFDPAPAGQATVILVRVGVSLMSSMQACSNAEEEVPDFDFENVRRENRAQWNELLGRVNVDPTGVSTETLQLLYTSLYRSHISPADYSGENPSWKSADPYYDSIYCNWDTFRTLFPLMSLHDPARFAAIVRGMINIQQHEGWLPECRGATIKQWVQGGSNADPILGEFFVKYHEKLAEFNVSANALYDALKADAEDEPPSWDFQGRQIAEWKKYNYIPHDVWSDKGMNTRQVSRSLEYTFDDFAISQVAKLIGDADGAARYTQRAGNFINVWNPNTTVPGMPGIRGMAQPRFANGTFDYTDPRHCSQNDPEHSTCFLDASNDDGFYESSPLVYSQFLPHDTARLIDLQGGADNFTQRLDFIFDNNYFDVSDEPSFQIPIMYHYANRPGSSIRRTRKIIRESFNTTVNGIPGNDDSGAMGSYLTFLLAGLYPVPVTRQYLLLSPFFREISIFNPAFNTTTRIISTNFLGESDDGSAGRIYIKNVMVNGEQYKSNCYLEWDIFVTGALVELGLTNDGSVSCGSGKDALPPSLSTGGFD